MGRASAARGVQRVQTLVLLLSWHLLMAPTRGLLIPLRGRAALYDSISDGSLAAKAEQAAVTLAAATKLSASTAAATVPGKGWGFGRNLSTSRRLLQPPGLPPAARAITLQELLANVDVSADSGGVRVALPPVPPPNRSSGSNSSGDNRPDDRGLPPVVVNIKLSDLFPPEPAGRKLHTSSSSSTTASSVSSSTTTSTLDDKAAGSSRRLPARLLQTASGSASSTGSTRTADTGLSAYMRSNPTVAPALQELTGRRNPSISDSSDAKSVRLCDLFTDSLCTASGAKRKLLHEQLQGLKAWGRRMLQAATTQQQQPLLQQQLESKQLAAAGQHASSAARRSLQQRDNLTSSQAEGLATWARQAPESDVQYVQAIVGGGFISRAQATPQLTIDQVVGPQQATAAPAGSGGRRKAGRKVLLLSPVDVAHGSADSNTAKSSSRSGRALLDGDTSNGGSTGTGTAGGGGTGSAGAAGDTGSSAGAGGGTGPGAGAASDAGAANDAGGNSATPEVRASDSSLGLTQWAAERASAQDVTAAREAGLLAPTSRLDPEDLKLTDLGKG